MFFYRIYFSINTNYLVSCIEHASAHHQAAAPPPFLHYCIQYANMLLDLSSCMFSLFMTGLMYVYHNVSGLCTLNVWPPYCWCIHIGLSLWAWVRSLRSYSQCVWVKCTQHIHYWNLPPQAHFVYIKLWPPEWIHWWRLWTVVVARAISYSSSS